MKSILHNFSFLFLLLVALYACEKPVQNFEIKDHDPKLVANAILTVDSMAGIHISRSKDLLDSRYVESVVSDVSVFIIVDNERNELLKTSDYLFKDASTIIKKGMNYRIEASAQGYQTIGASVTIPDIPAFSNIDTSFKKTTYPGCFDCSPEYFFRTDIDVQDDARTTDFYQIEFILIDKVPGDDDRTFESSFSAVTTSPFIDYAGSAYYLNPTDIGGESYGNSFYFSDQSFNGRQITISFYSDMYAFYNRLTMVIVGDDGEKEKIITGIPKFAIRFSRISADLYFHLKALATNSSLGDMPLTEPVYIPTNIENGLGILGAKASVDTLIDITDVFRQVEDIWNSYAYPFYD